jgi:pimeloyl-ACP methyl ester carboxylesterase
MFEHRMTLCGHATRALELEGDGPGIVLLHGWGESADTWRPLLAELGARERRAIAVDLPGFGEATRLRPGAVLPQLDEFAAELVETWAGGRPVVVAGNSLGGCVALRLAERRELPLAGVMPVAPDGLGLPGWFDLIERDPIVRKLLAIPIPVPGALVRGAAGGAYRQLSFSHPRVTQREVVDAFSARQQTRADVAELLESGRRLLPELSAAPFDLAGIDCPVLLVWGARDRLVPHTGARIALDQLPTTHVELIEGCGHCPQLEATGRLLELLLPFPA